MSWGVGARHLPRVVSYQQADKLEGTVVPIRGSGTNAGKKPAGSRKYPEITICRDAGGTIIVQGFESALIKYFPNGEVWIARDPYYQVTSNDIITNMLGLHTCSFDGRPWLAGVHFEVDGVQRHGHLPIPEEGAYLEGRENSWKLLNPEFPKVRKVNRKKMKKVRAQYKPFLKYFSGMLKLKDGEIVESGPNTLSPSYKDMLTVMGGYNLDEWNNLARHLINETSSLRWAGVNYQYVCKYSVAMRRANGVMLHPHRDLVFDVEEITTGAWVKDTNKKYFKD